LTRRRAALAGALAAAVMVGVSQYAAVLIPGGQSLVIALGDFVIDTVPGAVERAVISTLGTADKPFLIVNVLLVSVLAGAGAGIAACRRFAAGVVLLSLMAAAGTVAALSDPRAGTAGVLVVGAIAVAAGIGTLWALLRVAVDPATDRTAPSRAPAEMPAHGGVVNRRRFVVLAGMAAVVAGSTGALARAVEKSQRIERLRQAIRLPRPFKKAPAVPASADLEIDGVAPLFVPNDRFYRIDTALRVPQIDPADWSLQVKGMVARPFTLTYAELMAMPHIEADITLACVSNAVGGDLVGNARWQGVPLHRLLERAGLQAGAAQIIGRSVDGFTGGFPARTALDVKESMVAVAMNGEPLPAAHGFPARLVIPGLYGYVSATKWLSEIELTGWDVDGYWIPRGWSKEGPIKTQSRIDVPRRRSSVPAGRRPVAGVAWAPTRGIGRVEVRIDDGPWQPATLATQLDVDTWRQWSFAWDARPGRHVIAVRATDGQGDLQTDERTDVAPDGASGHHTIDVLVT
jgi:DMSO/TMAO reductase YedYZ molybdopterin-dependent catalytic subunit